MVIALHSNFHLEIGTTFEMPLFFLLTGIFIKPQTGGSRLSSEKSKLIAYPLFPVLSSSNLLYTTPISICATKMSASYNALKILPYNPALYFLQKQRIQCQLLFSVCMWILRNIFYYQYFQNDKKEFYSFLLWKELTDHSMHSSIYNQNFTTFSSDPSSTFLAHKHYHDTGIISHKKISTYSIRQ